jgi:amino acid transporter
MREMTVVDPDQSALELTDSHKLRGNMGTFQLLFTVLAFNGPIIAVVAFLPVVVGYGNGLGAPVLYIIASAIIALFATGFIKMSRHVENPGGFYSFVTKGLGREAGLGAALLAVVGYAMVYIGSYPLEGMFFQALLRDTLHGPDIQWWVWMLILIAVVSVFGYFNVEFSARALMVCMGVEAIMITVYDLAVVVQGGAVGLSSSSFAAHNIFSGNVGIGLLFAMLMFTGFEATVMFRDEVKDPNKTIPRASFGFIAFIGVTYGFTVWVLIQAIGPKDAVAATAADPTGSMLATVQQFAGRTSLDIITVLLCTSGFAAALALHNVLARYIFNLGVDGVISPRIGVAHPKHGSPYLASIALSAVVLAAEIYFILKKVDPLWVYAPLSGGFGYALMLLLFLTAVAIIAFMYRYKPADTTLWHRLIAPALALVGLGTTLWLATMNISLLVTGGDWVVVTMFVVIFGSLVVGIGWALVLKQIRPSVYAKLGRQ